ncbi:MAG: cytochrome c3 family protein [Treponemataceae bacterium]
MGYVVDNKLLTTDPHLSQECSTCHKGNVSGADKKTAHAGLVKRPSDDPATCATCHPGIAKNYTLSLHYTNAGMKNGVSARFSAEEKKSYDAKVFEQSCRSCHASCGDCHVKSPVISGVNTGLMDGHRFVKKDESKTCALCHGGRVYPEFTGDYGGTPDVHYRSGMSCTDCHSKTQMHGDGKSYQGRRDVASKPTCAQCHPADAKVSEAAKEAHTTHEENVSCSACHTATGYRNCSSCHLGEGAAATPALLLGDNPRKPGQLTTLRLIPTVRDTFKKAGIEQKNFDSLPNYWDTVPHNVKKRTDRTRDCATCHSERANFLEEDKLIKGGSKKNLELIHTGHY